MSRRNGRVIAFQAVYSWDVTKASLDDLLTFEWLQKDKFARRKQRHTAQRVFDRLTKEVPEFDCSYRLVAQYVSVRKKELNLTHQDGAIPLLHHPGEAQADFGTADLIEHGRCRKDGKYLVLSFPYSNAGYFQLHYGENMECLLESLVAIFEHIGGVPREICDYSGPLRATCPEFESHHSGE